MILSFISPDYNIGKGIALLLCSCNLPTWIGRATLKPRLIWFCNSRGLSFRKVTLPERELLPRVFTLTLKKHKVCPLGRLFPVTLSIKLHLLQNVPRIPGAGCSLLSGLSLPTFNSQHDRTTC
jgi:hypothetical protein